MVFWIDPKWLFKTLAGQIFSQNLAQLHNQHKTGEGSPDDDDSYLGYSVATGAFSGGGREPSDVAVGMPRGAGLRGKVLVYNSNLTNLHNLTGTQIGAYFGYSVASGDLNGDGLDDVVVGAPMWTDYTEQAKFETGRVYVFYQDASVSGLLIRTMGQIVKLVFIQTCSKASSASTTTPPTSSPGRCTRRGSGTRSPARGTSTSTASPEGTGGENFIRPFLPNGQRSTIEQIS